MHRSLVYPRVEWHMQHSRYGFRIYTCSKAQYDSTCNYSEDSMAIHAIILCVPISHRPPSLSPTLLPILLSQGINLSGGEKYRVSLLPGGRHLLAG